jgi:hypothetical protein
MPTIQQLVRSQRIQIKKKNKMSSTGVVLSDVVFVRAFTQLLLRNPIRQFEK